MTASPVVAAPRPLRELVRIAGPIVAGSVVTVLLSANDTVLLGRFGADAVAAAGIAVSVHMFCAVLVAGLAIAAQIHTARHIGAGEPEEAARAAAVTAALAAGAGAVLTALLLLLADPVTALLVDDSALAADAASYLRVLGLGLPLLGVAAALRGFASGTGRAGVVFVASACAAAVDVGLAIAWVAVGGPPIVVAVATAVAGAVSTAILLAWRRRQARAGMRVPGLRDLATWRGRLGPVWRTGWPEGAQLGLGTLSMVFVVALIAPYGPADLAAARVLDVVVGAVWTVLHGCGTAVAVLAGQRHGAGDRAAMRRVEGAGFRLAAVVAGLPLLLGLLGTPPILRLAVDDEAVVAAVTSPVVVLAWTQVVLMAAIAVANGVVRSTGDTRTGLVASLVAEYAVFLPLGVLLCRVLGLGLTGLYTAHLCYWAVYLAVVVRRRRRIHR